MTVIVDKKSPQKDSLDGSYIKNELDKIGLPFLPNSWEDEFLMAENLQNYFAEVIARFSYIRRTQEVSFDEETLKKSKLNWLELRNTYHKFKFSAKQQLLLDLMKENKNLSKKHDC